MATFSFSSKAVITVTNGGRLFVFDPKEGPVDMPYGVKRLSSFTDEETDGSLWCFFAEDCFDPSIHLVRAYTFEDAYEFFCQLQADIGHYLIQHDDPDYDEDAGHWTDDGRRVDTENFQGFGVELVSVKEPE